MGSPYETNASVMNGDGPFKAVASQECLLLGSVIGENKYDRLIVEDRDLSAFVLDEEKRIDTKLHEAAAWLGLSEMVKKEAFLIWMRTHKSSSKIAPVTPPYALYIASRMHGWDVSPSDIQTALGHKSRFREGVFIYKAYRIALDLGIVLPRINHDRLVLRCVDELGLGRPVYQEMKRLYAKARMVRSGNPRSTMGALLYLLAKPDHKEITQRQIAEKLGLKEYTIREAGCDIRNKSGLEFRPIHSTAL